mmetsp:Transcript_104686/g.293406  ORF Transcript_104686/g.293406 Transcript_104686/m.293406 type:complete len:156 (-) Transcript_104686:116-583(-)
MLPSTLSAATRRVCAADISPVSGLAAATNLQLRWRSRPKGGVYRPQYRKFPTEVKLAYPPKDRSKLWQLPESKNLVFVTNGWMYENCQPGADKKKPVTVLSFARRHTHNHIESLTFDEVTQLQKLLPDLEKQFAECEKTMAEDLEADAQLRHVCR